jgi:hypothetical protein
MAQLSLHINNTKKAPHFYGTNYAYWKVKMTAHLKSINREVWKVTETHGISTVDTPMELGVHLRPTDGAPLADPTRYRQLVESLVYLRITRPDISHSVHILSQFVSAPTQLHNAHLLRVL